MRCTVPLIPSTFPLKFMNCEKIYFNCNSYQQRDDIINQIRHYDDAVRINSVVKVYGVYLVNATSSGVFRVIPPGSRDTAAETGTW